MAHIVLERSYTPPINEERFAAMARESADCMPLYRVDWQESLFALDGSRLVCRFLAPDAEAVRSMARTDPTPNKTAWPGEFYPGNEEGRANVVVSRQFDQPVEFESLASRENAVAWCLEEHGVTYLRSLVSTDRRRMLCLYRAPDAEAVRVVQRQSANPVESIWPCRNFIEDDIAALLPGD
jgi:hypothetical protein